MAAQILHTNTPVSVSNSSLSCSFTQFLRVPQLFRQSPYADLVEQRVGRQLSVQCSKNETQILRTCKNCKTQFNPLLNHPRACRYHAAHFGGETKRKFEGVYTGGTMDTLDSGKVFQYWHCCGSEDPFDPGCTAAPHSSYDD